jgi:hypothetical protein
MFGQIVFEKVMILWSIFPVRPRADKTFFARCANTVLQKFFSFLIHLRKRRKRDQKSVPPPPMTDTIVVDQNREQNPEKTEVY